MPPAPHTGMQKKPLFHRAHSWYAEYEHAISSVALVGGFVLDLLTIQRVDAVWENSWILLHLSIVAVCIVLINRKQQAGSEEQNLLRERSHFWYVTLMQFSFGGLLSAFFLFYFRSSSLFVSWPFLLILALAFWANERLKHHYARITFQISFLFLSLFSFAIFIIPVLVHRVGTVIFIASGLLSLLIILGYLAFLEFVTKEQFFRGKSKLYYSITGIFLTLNFLYFFNIIPPIPLSLKDAGMYHSITKGSNGEYVVTDEVRSWKDYFTFYQSIRMTQSETLVAYSAVFSPTKLDTTIVHKWQRYDAEKNEWLTVSTVSLSVIGGRDRGYRTYSTKSALSEGKWRVSVENPRGQVIGRLPFEVVVQNIPPILSPKVVK